MAAKKKLPVKEVAIKPEEHTELTYIIPGLRPLAISVDDLSLDDRNARKHPEINLDAIKASLIKYGQRKPIVVQLDPETGKKIIRAGNGTFMATKDLGRQMVAAVIIEEDSSTAMGYAIADNRTNDLSEFDDSILLENIDDVLQDGFELADLGFFQSDYDKLSEKMRGSIEESSVEIKNDSQEFLLVISCEGENDQQELYEEFKQRGLACKIMS